MMNRLFRQFWTQLSIAFNTDFTPEGFERTQKKFELPGKFTLLDLHLKRKLTICNLFANQNQSIKNIARVLEVNVGDVVSVLIEDGFIKERRRTPKIMRQERRQEHLHPWSLTGQGHLKNIRGRAQTQNRRANR